MFPELSEGMASHENALRPTVGSLFRSSLTPWMAFDMDAKEKSADSHKRQMRLTGMIAVNFDRRREFEVKAQPPRPDALPFKYKIRDLQTRLDFIQIVQHFPWWRRVKALRAGCFYSILMTEQGEVFAGVADHVTICADMRGGAFVHTHLVKTDSKQDDHLQSCRRRAQFQDLRPTLRRIPVGWLLGAGKSFLHVAVTALIIIFVSAVWDKAPTILEWLASLFG